MVWVAVEKIFVVVVLLQEIFQELTKEVSNAEEETDNPLPDSRGNQGVGIGGTQV